jgi:hypothetical protein
MVIEPDFRHNCRYVVEPMRWHSGLPTHCASRPAFCTTVSFKMPPLRADSCIQPCREDIIPKL